MNQAVYYVAENDGSIAFSLFDTEPPDFGESTLQFSYRTKDLTAIAGIDYTSVSGSGVIQPGQNFFIPILDNDKQGQRSFEIHATFRQDFIGEDGAVLLTLTSSDYATVTIFDKTVVWNNDQGGRWTDPGNWAGGVVPKLGDNVIIDIPGVDITVRIPEGDFSIGTLFSNENLVVEGGLLTVNGPIVLRNLDIQPGATLALAGNEPASIQGGTLNNAGMLSWTGSGNLSFTDGANFNNLAGGTFRIHTAEPAGIEPTACSASAAAAAYTTSAAAPSRSTIRRPAAWASWPTNPSMWARLPPIRTLSRSTATSITKGF